jgi:hypothetical protein
MPAHTPHAAHYSEQGPVYTESSPSIHGIFIIVDYTERWRKKIPYQEVLPCEVHMVASTVGLVDFI